MPPSVPTPPAGPGPGANGPEQLSETGHRVFQSLSLGLIVFDHQFRIMHHNPAAAFIVRDHDTLDKALSHTLLDTHYQDWRQALKGVIDHGREARFEQVVFRDDHHGERLLTLICIALADPAGGPITGGTLVIEDVTAAVGLEKRLAVSERMAAVGKLAARIAHELNNPLDGIIRYLSLAERALDTDKMEKIPSYLNQARSGLMRMAEIVRELAEFSRSSHMTFDGAGINAVIEEAIKVMSDKAVANNVSVVCNLGEDIPTTRATNLFQVFCNLIKNAIDAMPDGGRLIVSTLAGERNLEIRFEDTGIGLPDEIDRIFEPFFTTKDAGKGTGLGLPICKDIVEKQGGSIVPERREGGGTRFTIRLPRQPEHAVSSDAADTPARRSRFSRTPGEETA